VPAQPPVPPARETNQRPGSGQTPPVQRPAERSNSVQNTLDRLRAQQAQNQPPRSRVNPAAGAPSAGGGAPTGAAALTSGEIRGVADKISECWSVDAGAPNLETIVVELRVEADAAGVVRVVRPAGSVPTEPRARAVFEAARRALMDPKCSPLPFPRDKLAAINNAIFRFNPRGLTR
jgi:hypothetical protein